MSTESTTCPPPPPLNTSQSFAEFQAYDWASDSGFQTGLQRIRENLPGSAITGAGTADLEAIEFKAKTFFFEKKFGVRVDQSEYKAWLDNQGGTTDNSTNTKKENDDSNSSSNKENEANPPYSFKYHEIVEMILNNKPIPGIKHIPDTVLGLEASTQSTCSHRSKPWEKQVVDKTSTEEISVYKTEEPVDQEFSA